MRTVTVNFTGNSGKTTLSDNLLWPRIGGLRFAIETINAGASDTAAEIERLKGKQFGELSGGTADRGQGCGRRWRIQR